MYSLTNTPSSETIEDFVQFAPYGAAMDLKQRIFQARTEANMTQDQLAEAVGKSRGAVAQWESGEVRPRHSTIEAIAAATNKDVAWLAIGGDDTSPVPSTGLEVVGEVAAGTWKEGAVTFERRYEPVARHPDYPQNGQRLYRVSGNSINRVAGNGEYLHAVELHDGGLVPESGDLVIVRRLQHGMAEYTAKTLISENGHWLLRPESDDPDWQSDIEMNGDDDTEITITDIVIAKWSPIARRRKVSK